MLVLFKTVILLMLNTVCNLVCHTAKVKSFQTAIMETRNKTNTILSAGLVKNGKQKRKTVVIQYDTQSIKDAPEKSEKSCKTKVNNKKKTVEKKENDYLTEKKNATQGRKAEKKVLKNEMCNANCGDVGDAKKTKWEPPHWREFLDNIREMRKKGDAPVDTMGCDQSSVENLAPEVRRYHVLISLMLSSQTKDEVNHAAMGRLREHGLTVDNICNTTEDVLGQLIIPVGFWKTKAKHIKMASEILKKDYGGDIPNTIELLCKLPGVGPKMAHLCMNHAWGIVTGIGVDVHVHRISHRLGWTKVFKTPEDTRKELESWLPESLWSEVNHLLVGFGQQICKSLRPSCEICLNRNLCPQGIKELAERAKKPAKSPKKRKS